MPPPNKPPVIIISTTGYFYPGQIIRIDATKTYDPDGSIKKVIYQFGDGDEAETKKPATIEHVYSKPGNYSLTVIAKDNKNSIASQTVTLGILKIGDNLYVPNQSASYNSSTGNPIIVNYPAPPTPTGGVPPYTIGYSIPDGSEFPIGTTSVQIIVSDSIGNTGYGILNITVVDTSIDPPPPDPLVVTPPPNQTGISLDGNPVLRYWDPAGVSGGVAPYNVVYKLGVTTITSPYSFPVAFNTIDITVTDAALTVANSSFSIEITFEAPTPGIPRLMQFADITPVGTFLTPDLNIGRTVNYPHAVKVVGSVRHYFAVDGVNAEIVEYVEPTLSAWNASPISSINKATIIKNWGPYPTLNGTYAPPTSGVFIYGLNYDPISGYLFLNWSATYVGIPSGINSFAAASFGATTLSRIGNWALNTRSGTTGQPMGASGVINIPQWFIDAYLPAGARLGVGMGGAFASATSLNSFGPCIEAIPMPASNSYSPGTDVQVSLGTILVRHPTNSNGPNCALGPLGCTPALAPTAPYPAKTAYNTYSFYEYTIDWEPYIVSGQLTGWWNNYTQGGGAWYDDGVVSGYVHAFLMPRGWAVATVLASPAPTTTSMRLDSLNTHDGNIMKVGDVVWAQSCVEGVNPGCLTANMNNFVQCRITAVNAGTNELTFVNVGGDSAGLNVPLVGGQCWFGVAYKAGAPQPSGQVMRISITSPWQFAEVVLGSRQMYDVVYSEDIDLTTLIPQFPSTTPFNTIDPTCVQVDPDNQRIIVFIRNAGLSSGAESSLAAVFAVSH